ncbi:MAG: TetR/AcrR family transcriptional regulator [Acidimicrobiales bacterium]
MTAKTANVIPLPLLAEGIPPRPPASLDPVLDAATLCIAARGLSRTTMSDIARELGVAPSTVYRKVGSVENAAWLVAAREAHALFDRLVELTLPVEGARKVTVVVAEGVRTAWDNPVFAKIMRDEPDFLGRALTRRATALLEQGVTLLAPFLAAGMDLGLIRRQDPEALAHWVVRIAAIALAAPPPGDLQAALDAVLLPMLQP